MVNKFDIEKLDKILEQYDTKEFYDNPDKIDNIDELKNCLTDYCKTSKCAVLGIDIYKYSSFKSLEQSLIPYIFKKLKDRACEHIIRYDKFLFQNYTNFDDIFVDTGDGGFFIFETPLHAISFAIHFEISLRAFNAYHFYPKLRQLINSITVRYTITYDDLYRFQNNYYGTGIINNARILSQDKLNRCLLDEKTYDWFMKYFNGIESIRFITDEEISKSSPFIHYKKEILKDLSHSTFSKKNINGVMAYGLEICDILKVGTITSKGDKFSIFNLHIQFVLGMSDDSDPKKMTNFIITLGNLNTSNIAVE